MKATMTSTDYCSQGAGFEQLTVRDAGLTCNVRLIIITFIGIHQTAEKLRLWDHLRSLFISTALVDNRGASWLCQ